MKRLILTAFILVCLTATSQVKIGNNPTTINPNAGLELEFNDKGLLLPRVNLTATANAAPLSAHVKGMVVYNTATQNDVTPGIYSNDGTKWLRGGENSNSAAVIVECNGFIGSYFPGTGSRSYTVTYTNNTFSAISVLPSIADLALTPSSGLTVGAVSPNVSTTINPGANLTVTYFLTGAINVSPNTVITGAFTKFGLNCAATVNVQPYPESTVNGPDGTTMTLMAHNLGADYSSDPHNLIPDIHGNYYQWGRPTPVADAYTQPYEIAGWNTTPAPNGAWMDGIKTVNDPCPAGFRIPTVAQWDDILSNNDSYVNFLWMDDMYNYSFGVVFQHNGTILATLPAAGYREDSEGILIKRGQAYAYWSSTEDGNDTFNLYRDYENMFWPSNPSISRTTGLPIRCIKE